MRLSTIQSPHLVGPLGLRGVSVNSNCMGKELTRFIEDHKVHIPNSFPSAICNGFSTATFAVGGDLNNTIIIDHVGVRGLSVCRGSGGDPGAELIVRKHDHFPTSVLVVHGGQKPASWSAKTSLHV